MNVGDWLRQLGLEQYEPAFRTNEIDERVLPSLTAEDLKDLGVSSGRASPPAARRHRRARRRCAVPPLPAPVAAPSRTLPQAGEGRVGAEAERGS